MIAAHILLTHSLLDKLLDAFQFRPEDNLQLSPRRILSDDRLEGGSKKFESCFDALKDWKKHFSKARSSMHKSTARGDPSNIQAFATEPTNPTDEQRRIMFAVTNFARGAARLQDNDYNQVLMNMEMMAFSIIWYSEVSDIYKFTLHSQR